MALTDFNFTFSDLLSCSGTPHFPERSLDGFERSSEERNYGREVQGPKMADIECAPNFALLTSVLAAAPGPAVPH